MDLITWRMTLKDVLGDIETKCPKLAASVRKAGIDGDAEYIRKGIVPSDMEFNKGERSVISTISTLAVDRDEDVMLPEGMDNKHFLLNPVVPFGHKYGELPLGSAKWVNQYPDANPVEIRAKTIYASEKANPFAAQVLQYQREGHPLAKSIGFIPVKSVTPDDNAWDKAVKSWRQRRVESFEMKGIKAGDRPEESDPKRIYTDWILLEYSDVPIPSNPEAVNIAVSKGLLTQDSAKAYLPIEEQVEDNDTEDAEVIREDEDEERGFDDIYFKAGRMLSGKNEKIVSTAHGALGDLLDANAASLETDTDKTISKADGPWNKTLSKSFDIAEYDAANTVFRYSLFTKHLDCQVKEIYVNSYHIPSPLLGTYLEAISVVTGDMTIDDTRRFNYDGKESPPSRSYIQLNSKRRKRFLVDGSQYCHEGSMALVKDFDPGWYGLQFSIVTSNEHEEWSDLKMAEIHEEANNNHMLKGEKFALSGEFLSDTDDEWGELVINAKDKQAIQKSMDITGKASGNSRGLLFVGPPGTGKTKAGRTIMNDTDSTFIWVSARDFMYGMPSSIMALAFDMSRKLAPTVLFMEDVDKSLDKDMLKTELDGLKQNKGLMTILTTNHPDRLPKALIDRPGRFHHVILFDLPDSGQRKRMFQLWAGDIAAEILDELVKATDGFSGAHINHLVEYSQTIAEDEDLEIGIALLESMIRMSDQMDLVAGLQGVETKELFNMEDLRRTAEETDDGWEEITAETAELLLEIDDQEKQAAAEAREPTLAERLHNALGNCV